MLVSLTVANLEHLLPAQNLAVTGLEIDAKHAPVAGDFYQFLTADGRNLGVLVADISGHGCAGGVFRFNGQGRDPGSVGTVRSPAKVLAGINSIVCAALRPICDNAYAFDIAQRQLSYSCVGDPSLLLWRARAAKVQTIEQNGLMLSMFPSCDDKRSNEAFTCDPIPMRG